nr:endonuclease/exonuclease/phosphatase family protein [Halorientalis brevis]
MAFRKKKEQLLQHDPDILVIAECESPQSNGDWSDFSDWRWIGENEHKGLGIFARNGITLDSAFVDGDGGRYSIPVTTDTAIDLLGIWAMNDKQQPANRYIGQVYRSLQDYQDWIDSQTVVLGDFNWNVIWDESPKSPLCGNFAETVDILQSHELHSAYHTVTDTAFGNEEDATFYMHKSQDKEYHIDYIFAGGEILDSVASFSVGDYTDWIDASDHMPVICEFE